MAYCFSYVRARCKFLNTSQMPQSKLYFLKQVKLMDVSKAATTLTSGIFNCIDTVFVQ